MFLLLATALTDWITAIASCMLVAAATMTLLVEFLRYKKTAQERNTLPQRIARMVGAEIAQYRRFSVLGHRDVTPALRAKTAL
jgi:hypothetical protein